MLFSTLSSWALLAWKALESRGHEPREVFTAAGLDPDHLNDPNARYPVEKMARLWRLCADTVHDPCFGLSMAQFWHPTTWHALGYAWLASTSLKDALQRTERYIHIVSTAAAVELQQREDDYRFAITAHAGVRQWMDPLLDEPEQPGTILLTAVFGTLVKMCRTSYGEAFAPIALELQCRRPECAAQLDEYFRAPIHYGSPENALLFSRHTLEQSLPTANAELAQASDQIVARYIADLDRSAISMRVKTALLEQLSSGTATEESIADALHMSLRSLQRKLREEDTTYKQLLDDTRRELAEQYLDNSRLSISEITYLLGFAEPSTFSRAFKRWNGVSPSAYRDVDQAP